MFREFTRWRLHGKLALPKFRQEKPPEELTQALQILRATGLEEDIIEAWMFDLKVQNARKKIEALGWRT